MDFEKRVAVQPFSYRMPPMCYLKNRFASVSTPHKPYFVFQADADETCSKLDLPTST